MGCSPPPRVMAEVTPRCRLVRGLGGSGAYSWCQLILFRLSRADPAPFFTCCGTVPMRLTHLDSRHPSIMPRCGAKLTLVVEWGERSATRFSLILRPPSFPTIAMRPYVNAVATLEHAYAELRSTYLLDHPTSHLNSSTPTRHFSQPL